MAKKKIAKKQSKHTKILVPIIITLVLATVLLINLHQRLSTVFEESSPLTGTPAPTLRPQPVKPGWKTFTDPHLKFTFAYPESWHVDFSKPEGEQTYTLSIIYQESDREYAVEFMKEGRGAPYFDSVDTADDKNGTFTKNIYLQGNAPFEELITYKDQKIIQPYVGIDAQIAATNGNSYLQTVNDIASSVKLVK